MLEYFIGILTLRGVRYVYGLDDGNGFMCVYLFPNSQVTYIKDNQPFTCQLHFNKMVKERNEKGNEIVTLCLPNFKTVKYIRFLFFFMRFFGDIVMLYFLSSEVRNIFSYKKDK